MSVKSELSVKIGVGGLSYWSKSSPFRKILLHMDYSHRNGHQNCQKFSSTEVSVKSGLRVRVHVSIRIGGRWVSGHRQAQQA